MSDSIPFSTYKCIEVGQATGSTDTEYDFASEQSGAGFVATSSTKLLYAGRVVIKTDQTITIKFNLAANDAMIITSAEGAVVFEDMVISKIFISNASGSTANVKMRAFGKAKVSL